MSSSTNSLDQFAQTHKNKKKSSRRKSRVPSDPVAILEENSSSIARVEPTESAQTSTHKIKSSKTKANVAPSIITSTDMPVLPTTSREVMDPSSTSNKNVSRYVIPKKGIQANKLNELARKVSPPARPILPKSPVVIRTSPPRNTSGNRPNPGQKKKK